MEKVQSLVEQFSELSDHRQRINQEHKFIDILVIAICAPLYGAVSNPGFYLLLPEQQRKTVAYKNLRFWLLLGLQNRRFLRKCAR